MGWLSGMLTGYMDRHHHYEKQERDNAERRAQQQERIYTTLMDHPDKKIQHLAATGILELGKPARRKGGLAGFIGELETSPTYAVLQRYFNEEQPVGGGSPTALRLPPPSGAIRTPPSSAAMPAQSVTEPGTPPLTRVQPAPSPAPAMTPARQRPASVLSAPSTPTPTPPPEPPPPAFRPVFQGETAGTVEMSPQPLQETPGTVEMEENPDIPFRSEVTEAMPPEPPPPPQAPLAWRPPRMEYPRFPTAGDTVAMRERAEISGTVAGYAEMFMQADPSLTPEQAHQQAAALVAAQHLRQSGQTAGMHVINAARAFGYPSPEAAFAQGGPEVYKQVLAYSDRLRQEASYNTRLGSGVAGMDIPITVPQAAATGATVGTTSRDYAGDRVATAPERARRTAAQNIRAQLAYIKTLLHPLPTSQEWFGNTFPGWQNWINQVDPARRNDYATLTSAISNIQALLTRTAQGNVGTQTEQDAERAIQSLVNIQARLSNPTQGDTQESAAARLDETIQFLDTVIAGIPPALVAQPPPQRPGAGATSAPTSDPNDPDAGWTPPPTGGPYTSPSGRVYFNGQPI